MQQFQPTHRLPEFGAGLRSHLARATLVRHPAPDSVAGDLPAEPLSSESSETTGAPAWVEWRPPQGSPAGSPPALEAYEPLAAPADAHPFPHTLLRQRAEEQAERLWRVCEEALRATTAAGAPDHALRLEAVRLLLAGGYEPSPSAARTPAAAPETDDLADFRRRRRLLG